MGTDVLVVCRDNWVRSRAVEKYLRENDIDADSCGTGLLSHVFGKRFCLEMAAEYDVLIAADDKIYGRLFEEGVDSEKILNIEIPNVYWKFVPFGFFGIEPERRLNDVIPGKLESYFSSAA